VLSDIAGVSCFLLCTINYSKTETAGRNGHHFRLKETTFNGAAIQVTYGMDK